MMVISIRQPWAWMIIHAGKDIENRDWKTSFRGRVLVHASKGVTQKEWAEAWQFAMSLGVKFPGYDPKTIELGGIIGSVEIVDCVQETRFPGLVHPSQSPWFFGLYGFVLRDPKPLPFTPCRGQLGIRPLDPSVRIPA